MKGNRKFGVVAGCFFLFCLILVLQGAMAFSFDFNFDNPDVVLYDNVSFQAIVNIDSGERLPVDFIDAVFSGPTNLKCSFNSQGNPINGCSGVNVFLIENSSHTSGSLEGIYLGNNYNFGNGFGYEGQGKLRYGLKFNSTLLGEGIYTTKLVFFISGQNFTLPGENLTIYRPIVITSGNESDSCVLEGQSFVISANIKGSLSEVYATTEINGTTKTTLIPNTGEGNYSYFVNGSEVKAGNMRWRFSARDIKQDLTSGNFNNFYINHRTILDYNPANPDGLNGWYMAEPIFTLINPDTSDFIYKWNGEEYGYTGPFGLEGAPNQGNVTGGILVLKYQSDLCSEPFQEFLGKFDFKNPIIKNLDPQENETIFTSRPLIQALLEETYQSNSGIDKSKVVVLLDGNVVNANITNSGSLDAVVRFNVSNGLSAGEHEVEINASDKAGRTSNKKWKFYVGDIISLNLTIFSPMEKVYDSRRIQLNITTSQLASEIGFINHNDRVPKFRKLCLDCDEYGNSRRKYLSLSEGENRIDVIASSNSGESVAKSIFLIVDSRAPVISSTKPRKGFSLGTFEVEFREQNPRELILHYGNSLSGFRESEFNFSQCSKEREVYDCSGEVNLSDYDGEKIVYSFVLNDVSNKTANSKEITLDVDFTSPLIISYDIDVTGRYLQLFSRIDELNFDQVRYIDHFELSPRYRKLCSKLDNGICNKTQRFSLGDHNITIEALDKAGNKAVIVDGFGFSI
ncbi:MAG: hypothetical protein AABY05_03515 [Nanoarchaeota archaeon]